MKKYGQLTREELLEDLDALAEIPEFLCFRNDYMRHAVGVLDAALARVMLGIGANPDKPDGWSDGYLRDLLEGFISQRTAKGEAVLAMMELLLANGADPDFVGSCNLRAIDRAMSAGWAEVVDLLTAAGADKAKREFI